MAKKDFALIVDTETTQDDKVADFAAIVTDRKGKIYTQCAVLVNGIYNDAGNHPLFFDGMADPNTIWSRKGRDRRYDTYQKMIEGGTRQIASVAAINRWLDKARTTYNPWLTAYNLPFDANKCGNTGIDLAQYGERKFCLWAAAAERWVQKKAYKEFALQVHAFNNPTAKGNMTYKANAETMARFVLQNPDLVDEPHTALEDIIFYELPIFTAVVKGRKMKDFAGLSSPAWQSMQVKDHFTAR